MCLEKVDYIFENNRGWKIFEKTSNNRLKPFFMDHLDPYKIGEWHSDENIRASIIAMDLQEYPMGYHIFLNKEDAEVIFHLWQPDGSILREVEYDGIVALGSEEGKPIVVASKMRILPLDKKERR